LAQNHQDVYIDATYTLWEVQCVPGCANNQSVYTRKWWSVATTCYWSVS